MSLLLAFVIALTTAAEAGSPEPSGRGGGAPRHEPEERASSVSLSAFMPTRVGTFAVYRTAAGEKRIESVRVLNENGSLVVDVEENEDPSRRFTYETRLDGSRFHRRGPEGEEIAEVESAEASVQVAAGSFPSCVKLKSTLAGRDHFLYLAPGTGLVLETILENGRETRFLELLEYRVPEGSPVPQTTEDVGKELDRIVAQSEEAPLRLVGGSAGPVRVSGREPEVPAIARRANVRGSVVADILIEKDGAVSEVRILRGGFPFDNEVRRTTRTWKYKPTMVGGKPVRVSLRLTFKFE